MYKRQCLHCFQCFCTAHLPRHTQQRRTHHLFLHLKKTPVAPEAPEGEPAPLTKLAVTAEMSQVKYDVSTQVHDHLAGPDSPDLLQGGDAELAVLVADLLASTAAHDLAQLESWEEQIQECEHTLLLVQDPNV